ncbi:MAG: hypothetical protein EAZ97_11755 [Bacteroidetes bacterium]|nr:MAG: hypothetical protein EAZ97_11755 [Bacteroidota bacterium]
MVFSIQKYNFSVAFSDLLSRVYVTLRQYILISQDKIQVENFVKNTFGQWVCSVYTSKNDYFAIIEDQFQLCVGDLYWKTSLLKK